MEACPLLQALAAPYQDKGYRSMLILLLRARARRAAAPSQQRLLCLLTMIWYTRNRCEVFAWGEMGIGQEGGKRTTMELLMVEKRRKKENKPWW